MKKYIVAVSGGLDSVTLLHLLANISGHPELVPGSNQLSLILEKELSMFKDAELVVAHVNHGVRPDSDRTEALVKRLAQKYKLKFISTKLKLKGVGEDEARRSRYSALFKFKDDMKAEAIITAHNHNDVIETAVINLIRGTGWRGLASLSSNSEIIRPLLSLSRADIAKIAGQANLVWHEDSTNSDEGYLRNRVRKNLLPSLSLDQQSGFSSILKNTLKLKFEINQVLDSFLNYSEDGSLSLRRSGLRLLGSDLTKELLVYILPKFSATYDKKVVNALEQFCRSSFSGKRFLQAGNSVVISTSRLGETKDYEVKFSHRHPELVSGSNQ
jgi:tRNA(Ile)-lysidine synthetase-like protein